MNRPAALARNATGSPWADAIEVAWLLAIAPAALGGIVLRSASGPVRDLWMEHLRTALPQKTPMPRVPPRVDPERLQGGLDLAATLAAKRPITSRGLLEEAHGGVLVVAMAERTEAHTAALLAAALDSPHSALAVLALDEGMADEAVAPALAERLAFHLDLGGIAWRDACEASAPRLDDARALFARAPPADDELPQALCATALALGIGSLRAPWLALQVARARAALHGRAVPNADDAARAAQLVLAPRALTPDADSAAADEPPDAAASRPNDASSPGSRSNDEDAAPSEASVPEPPASMDDRVLDAAAAVLPSGLLDRFASARLPSARKSGASGSWQSGVRRGARAGVRAARPRDGERLDLIATLRAAAPWQGLRATAGDRTSVQIRMEDLRTARYRERAETTILFVVDASGSLALHRLAEAKGAVEHLLAESYVRRDKVALLAFRGTRADLLLAPTRSLVRAKRSLAALPGGGGTPLATALDATALLADSVRRRGGQPLAVLLTDGRANVARDGIGGRQRAADEAFAAARRLRATALEALLIDASPHPQPVASQLAAAIGATYVPLPHADAVALSGAVRQARDRGGQT